MIECICLFKVVMQAIATLPLNGTVMLLIALTMLHCYGMCGYFGLGDLFSILSKAGQHYVVARVPMNTYIDTQGDFVCC